MKTTYLIYKTFKGERQLAVATKAEWDTIMKNNKGLPMDKRRLFERSCFESDDGLDCMYIEVDRETYNVWHSKDVVRERNRKTNEVFTVISLDAPVPDSELSSMHETISSDYDLDLVVTNQLLLQELAKELKAWKPWATELLAIYLNGQNHTCNAFLCKKYGLKERAVRYRKKQFEEFVKIFLKKFCRFEP